MLGTFNIATAPICDENTEDLIIMSTDSMSCGSGGCGTIVLHPSADGYQVLLNQNLGDSLGVYGKRVGTCKQLAAIDENGKILIDDKQGTPLYQQQMVYPMTIGTGKL